MTDTRFKLSFTSLPLGLREAEVVVPLWLESKDWEQVYQEDSGSNLFQKEAVKSTVSIFREIRHRLETLDPESLEDSMDSGVEDRKAILLLAACKCNPILYSFIREVMWENTLVFDYSLEAVDFDKFWNRLAEEDESLENITDSTRAKVRQVTFRILFEAGLLSRPDNPNPYLRPHDGVVAPDLFGELNEDRQLPGAFTRAIRRLPLNSPTLPQGLVRQPTNVAPSRHGDGTALR